MDDSTSALLITSMLIMLLSLLSVSYKSGFVFLSIWSATRPNQPKFEIDKDKAGRFIAVTIGAFLLNVACSFIIIRDFNELEGILILSFFNTIFIAYGLSYWMLLKEKKE